MRTIFAITVFLMISSTSAKQNRDIPFCFVIQGGISKIDLNYNNPPVYWKKALRIGTSIDLFCEYKLNRLFSMDFGIELAKLGDKRSYKYTSELVQLDTLSNQWITIDTLLINGTREKNMIYASFPLHLIINLAQISSGFKIGPSFGYAIDAYVYTNENNDHNMPSVDNGNADVLKIINKLNLQLQIGYYYECQISKIPLLFGIMYSEGLTKINNKSNWASDFKSNEFRLSIGTKIKPKTL